MKEETKRPPEHPPEHWWSRPAEEIVQTIGVDLDRGLLSEQVNQSRHHYGSNQREDRGPTSLWTLLW